jgi:hypothetical protein
MARGEFFAVGRQTVVSACKLGVNAGATFLVLARGSGGDNVTTSWSAQAGSKYLGTRWKTANAAIAQLESARIIKRDKTSSTTRPRYTLAKKGELIWLPNSLVDGAGGEIPPITKMRQTQDVMALRLLVEFYGKQNLREDGGISPKVIWRPYEREQAGQRGATVVWRFHNPTTTAGSYEVTGLTITEPSTEPSEYQRVMKIVLKNGLEDFWLRLRLLEQLGLIEWVPYLFEGPEGEPIHPVHANSALDIEAELYAACHEAARRCLTEGQYDLACDKGGVLVPVPSHIQQVQLIGIARLRYRPHTSLTSAWWEDQNACCRGYTEGYARIASSANAAPNAREVA